MSFERGNLSLTVFRIMGKLPENALELFAAKSARKLEDITDSPSAGWTGGRDLLQCNINEASAIYGGHIFMQLRIAQRKIPADMLNAACRREELEYMTMNKLSFVPVKVRRQIRKDISEKMLPGAAVKFSGIPFVIDRQAGLVYLGATSPNKIGIFLSIFQDTFNDTWLAQVDAEDMRFRLTKDNNPLVWVKFANSSISESTPGRDFLTWLWYYSEEKGGIINTDSASFQIMIEGPLTFAVRNESEGSREIVVRKDNPVRSAEAKAALSTGKKLKKAKFTIARGKEVWAGTFDADLFCFSGLSLPEGETLDSESEFMDRVNSLHVFENVILQYFATFAVSLTGTDWPKEQEQILAWSEARNGY